MKKSKKIAIVAVTLVAGFLLALSMVPILALMHFNHVDLWRAKVENFDDYKGDFMSLADFTKDFFESENNKSASDNRWLMVLLDNESGNFYLSNDGVKLDLTEEVQNSLNRVSENAFPSGANSVFYTIYYFENRISFGITTFRYSLVYSFNDERPDFVNSPTENNKIKVKKIEDNWYHVVAVS